MMPDTRELRTAVRDAYSDAARSPEGRHPFPVGRAFAESVGYGPALLQQIPDEVTSRFAGVSNVGAAAPVEPGMTVLDLGCGAGLDCMVVRSRCGPGLRLIGVDFSAEMLRHARGVNVVQASAEMLPLEDGGVDLAMVNGIFNLNPFRQEVFRELARVVKPGGRVFGAELILRAELPVTFRAGLANWFS